MRSKIGIGKVHDVDKPNLKKNTENSRCNFENYHLEILEEEFHYGEFQNQVSEKYRWFNKG